MKIYKKTFFFHEKFITISVKISKMKEKTFVVKKEILNG